MFDNGEAPAPVVVDLEIQPMDLIEEEALELTIA
jgi:hypothetical protein